MVLHHIYQMAFFASTCLERDEIDWQQQTRQSSQGCAVEMATSKDEAVLIAVQTTGRFHRTHV